MAALASLGEVCHALGELTVASAMLDEAMECCHELGDPTVEVDILRVQALIARDHGDLSAALAIAQRAEAVAELIDRHECVVRLHIVSGAVRLARDEPPSRTSTSPRRGGRRTGVGRGGPVDLGANSGSPP
jgi:hypothetical protein